MHIASFTIISLFFALAVKQLSYALSSGSLFSPLRKSIENKADEGVLGFGLLYELFTCKLCMTMQMSIWFVMLPVTIAEICFGFTHAFVGVQQGSFLSWTLFAIAVFIYQTAISALALALWNFLEYPAKRYEDTLQELKEAQRTVENLVAALSANDIDVPEGALPDTITYDDFRAFMLSMNKDCGRFGCGYMRRNCRTEAVAAWLEDWAKGSQTRLLKLPKLRKALTELMPVYFRRYSRNDRAIENEAAFTRLHANLLQVFRG